MSGEAQARKIDDFPAMSSVHEKFPLTLWAWTMQTQRITDRYSRIRFFLAMNSIAELWICGFPHISSIRITFYGMEIRYIIMLMCMTKRIDSMLLTFKQCVNQMTYQNI